MKVRIIGVFLLCVIVLAVAVGCSSNNTNSTNNGGNASNASIINDGIAPNGMTGMEILARTNNLSISSMQIDIMMHVDGANDWMSMNWTANVVIGGNISGRQMYMTAMSSVMPDANSSMYVINGWIYDSEPGAKIKWIKTRLTDDIWDDNFALDSNLGYVGMDIVADAKYISMESVEGVNCYKIAVTPDVAAFMNTSDMSDLVGGDSSTQDMFKGSFCTVWIAADTYYPAKLDLNMKEHRVTKDSVTVNLSMQFTETFSKVNQYIDVVLPKEANNATAISYETFVAGEW